MSDADIDAIKQLNARYFRLMDTKQWDEWRTGRGINRGFTGYGHYEEEYRREDGEWKIAFLRLTRLKLNPILGEPQPEMQTPFLSSRGRNWLGLG